MVRSQCTLSVSICYSWCKNGKNTISSRAKWPRRCLNRRMCRRRAAKTIKAIIGIEVQTTFLSHQNWNRRKAKASMGPSVMCGVWALSAICLWLAGKMTTRTKRNLNLKNLSGLTAPLNAKSSLNSSCRRSLKTAKATLRSCLRTNLFYSKIL